MEGLQGIFHGRSLLAMVSRLVDFTTCVEWVWTEAVACNFTTRSAFRLSHTSPMHSHLRERLDLVTPSKPGKRTYAGAGQPVHVQPMWERYRISNHHFLLLLRMSTSFGSL